MKVLIVVAFLAVFQTATALECFVCNSKNDTACADDFPEDSVSLKKELVEKCRAPKPEDGEVTPFCRKIKYYIYDTGIPRIQRDCGYRRREGYDCYQKRSEDYVMDTCVCDTDLCNGAPAVFTSMTSILIVSVPLIFRFL